MKPSTRRLAVLAALVFSPSFAIAQPAPAGQGPALGVEGEAASGREIDLEVGQSRLLRVSTPIGRVSVAEPGVADVAVYTNTQVNITAKSVGDTYLTLWDRSERSMVLSVHVRRNLDALRRQLADLFPGEKIDAAAAGDLVVLSGEVSDVRIPERVAEVAKLHAAKIANLLRVRGNQQVQLEVKFAEVSRGGLREMGVNFFHQAGDRAGGMTVPGVLPGNFQNKGNLAIPGTDAAGVPAVNYAPFGNAFSLFFSGLAQFPFSVMVSLLEQQNLAKTLAEPTLVAMSGQEARFIAGGEFPIPLMTSLGGINIDYKKFGIQLRFQPTVLGDGFVNLHLFAEVSDIDPTLSVSVGGFSIPGLTQRQSETTVRLRDGQSFAIAGLLSDRMRSTVGKIPLLGDIPLLGALFRSTQYRREETELLVLVTVHLVKPLGANEVPPMPGQNEQSDPGDFELFLLGRQTSLVRPKVVEPGQAIPVKNPPTSTMDNQKAPQVAAPDKPAAMIRTEGGPAGPHGYARER